MPDLLYFNKKKQSERPSENFSDDLLPYFVAMFTSADIPGARRSKSCCPASNTIFTAMRWAILTKLPVPLSALIRLNSEAVAG